MTSDAIAAGGETPGTPVGGGRRVMARLTVTNIALAAHATVALSMHLRFLPCLPCQQSRAAEDAVFAFEVTRAPAVRAREVPFLLSWLAEGVAVTTTSKAPSYACDELSGHLAQG